MASNPKVEGDERKHPSLIITVLAALAAQVRELNAQLASLSAGKTRIQSTMSEQSNQIIAQSEQIKELKLSNALLKEVKDAHNWASSDKQVAKATDLAIALRIEAAKKPVTAAHLRAEYVKKRLEVEQNLDKTTSDVLNLELTNEMDRDAAGGAPLSLRKRKQEFSENSGRPAKKSKRATVVCVECYKFKTHKQCDGSSPCWPCKYLDKECKRMRCKHFTTGTCPISNCTRAHSDSGFSDESLVNSYHVAQSTEPAPTIPPKPTTD
ncbi:unnamed protein product [Alternaria alternata]|nr:hypothetical protein AALT_g2363 [Alternaria alternata]RYO67812.1 hypothetical protein AA0116_g536 [Alternaria tenuissima]